MIKTEAQKRAEKKWRAEKMHRIAIDCTLSDYDRISAAAAASGQKIGTFCRAAIMQAVQGSEPGETE